MDMFVGRWKVGRHHLDECKFNLGVLKGHTKLRLTGRETSVCKELCALACRFIEKLASRVTYNTRDTTTQEASGFLLTGS